MKKRKLKDEMEDLFRDLDNKNDEELSDNEVDKQEDIDEEELMMSDDDQLPKELSSKRKEENVRQPLDLEREEEVNYVRKYKP
jgi:hypothetical protein